MVDFDHLGYELNRCGGFLDGIQNCIQTCLHHTVHMWMAPNLKFKGGYGVYKLRPQWGNFKIEK